MRPSRCVLALLAALLLAAPGAQAKGMDGMRDGSLSYLETQARTGAGSLAANVAEAASANGLDAAAWPPGATPIAQQVVVPPEGAAFIRLLRPLRALALAGDARAPDLAERVRDGFDGNQFGSATAVNDDAYAILALRAAGASADDGRLVAAAAFLREHRNADGGWGWAVDAPSSTDMTGLALWALQEAGGATADELSAATALVRAHRDGDGFAESADATANCESTVWGLRTLALAGAQADPFAWRFLLSLQQPDGGFSHLEGGDADLLCTTEVAGLLAEVQAGRVPFSLGRAKSDIPTASAFVAILVATGVVVMSTRIRQP